MTWRPRCPYCSAYADDLADMDRHIQEMHSYRIDVEAEKDALRMENAYLRRKLEAQKASE